MDEKLPCSSPRRRPAVFSCVGVFQTPCRLREFLVPRFMAMVIPAVPVVLSYVGGFQPLFDRVDSSYRERWWFPQSKTSSDPQRFQRWWSPGGWEVNLLLLQRWFPGTSFRLFFAPVISVSGVRLRGGVTRHTGPNGWCANCDKIYHFRQPWSKKNSRDNLFRWKTNSRLYFSVGGNGWSCGNNRDQTRNRKQKIIKTSVAKM